MSEHSTAVADELPTALERPGAWRRFGALLATPFVALWKSWSAPDAMMDFYELSEAELLDMGASPDELAEANARRELELHRAYAMSLYYW
ncbi:hypothetical protein [Bordetella bronchialis]|uniref:DUF1127 domain-containing protein n=2 Tax=Bordetella bronchialis TaxID=463025 RepID=A0A193FZP2_9BORD|nr:hypothetical protein BAU06_18425 [Bordetella bronchialis]ANN73095.1 hypothetical protein BAU08_18665 [Bordetella bronchialis]